jgi:hypothetical protein
VIHHRSSDADAGSCRRWAPKGLVNLTKLVPGLEGIVGGGVNVVVTRQIGNAAARWLKEGPAPGDVAGDVPATTVVPTEGEPATPA